MQPQPPRPTDSELEILNVLWELGPSTVRQVLQRHPAKRPVGYTTILKLLQIMTEKGLVARDESSRTHIYRAKSPKEQTQKRMLKEMATRLFGGSSNQLVMRALRTSNISADEIEQIRTLLNQIEQGK